MTDFSEVGDRLAAIRERAAKWTMLPLDYNPNAPESIIRFLLAEIDRANAALAEAREQLNERNADG